MIKRHKTYGRLTHSGTTLIEMLVVTLIFSVMMAIGTSLFLSAVADSATKECRANMMTVANIDQEYMVKSSSHAYTTSISALSSQVPFVPKCPDGGTYTITISTGTSIASNGQTVPAGKILISCSTAGHGVFAPDIDSN